MFLFMNSNSYFVTALGLTQQKYDKKTYVVKYIFVRTVGILQTMYFHTHFYEKLTLFKNMHFAFF